MNQLEKQRLQAVTIQDMNQDQHQQEMNQDQNQQKQESSTISSSEEALADFDDLNFNDEVEEVEESEKIATQEELNDQLSDMAEDYSTKFDLDHRLATHLMSKREFIQFALGIHEIAGVIPFTKELGLKNKGEIENVQRAFAFNYDFVVKRENLHHLLKSNSEYVELAVCNASYMQMILIKLIECKKRHKGVLGLIKDKLKRKGK